jgi:CDP-diacylglycerol--serine O-phosphatidyltransferase
LANLLAGIIAIMLAVKGQLVGAALFVLIGIVFDFFDGFVARLLKVQSELGKQLDSLADMVTSGIVPGIVMCQLFERALHQSWMDGLSCEIGNWSVFEETDTMLWAGFRIHPLPFLGLLLSLAAAYRLATFNIDERQTSSFIGLPTPSMTLVVLSLPMILAYSDNEFAKSLILNNYVLAAITIVLSVLMNVSIPLFALKFNSFSVKNNAIEIIFILISIVLLLTLQFVAIPLIITLYIILSLLKNSIAKD